jgi:hypothetical protein
MTDFVYNQTTVGLFHPQLWLTLEPDMAIICACLPVLRPLITMVLASSVYRSIASHLTVGRSRSSISSEGAGTGSGSGSGSDRHRKHAALNTIGGSTAPGGRAGRGQSHHAREKSQGSGITKNTLSSFESLEYLGVEDVEAGRLVPETNGRVWSWHVDPSIGHQAQVSRSQSVALDEVPVGAISVKTVVDCTETTGESHQLPAS